MSGKTQKKIRRTVNKLNKQVFMDFVVEISVMPFWRRLWFCLKMAFNRHGLQKHLKDNIEARRKLNADGELK